MNKFNLIGCIGILAVCYGVGGRIHIQSPRHVEKTLFANAVAGTYEAKQTAVACASTEASIQTTSLGTALSASEAWQRNEELQETRHHVRMDPYYPRFHLAPPVGWMNDPHPIYFKGAYHLFYQYSYILDRPYGGSHAWGHAMSSDLVRWRHYPPAVTPKDHGISEDAHIFSGCVVDNDGTGTALYTIKNNDIWLAISPDDDLTAFERCPANPVIKGPPPGLDISNMRDPWAWKEADGWYLIVGSGLRDGRGPVLPLYHSTSLRDWTYLHPLYQGDTTKDGSFCECPSFFPIGDKHVLVLSHQATYLVGRYENRRFTPEQRDRLDHGWIYVPQFVLDAKGRRIMWGWVPGWRQDLPRPREDVIRAGWSGLLTVPRVVTLGPDDRLRFEPVKEIEMLRDKHVCLDDVTLLPNTTLTLDRPRGAHLEIDATLRASEANQYGVILLDSQQRIEVEYNLVSGSLRLGRQSGPLKLEQGEPLRLRIFVDGLVVEVFANRRLCLTEMIYPAQPKILQVGLFAHGGCATADRVEVWQMNSHWVK